MSQITSQDAKGNEYKVELDELTWRIGAYGIVVLDGKILLTKQHGKYHTPGGGVHLHEDPAEAVVREIKEETGIDVVNPRLVKHSTTYFSWPVDQPTTHHRAIQLFFICQYIGGELSTDGFMVDEAAVGELAEWIPLSELDTVTAGSTFDWRTVVKEVLELN